MEKQFLDALRKLSPDQHEALWKHGVDVVSNLSPDVIRSLLPLTPAQIENLKGFIGVQQPPPPVAVEIQTSPPAEEVFPYEEKIKLLLLGTVVTCSLLALTFKIPVLTVFALALFFPFATELIFILYDYFIIPEYEANEEIKGGNIAVAVHNGVLRFCILFGLVAGFYAISSYDTTPEGVAAEPSAEYRQPSANTAAAATKSDTAQSGVVPGMGSTED